MKKLIVMSAATAFGMNVFAQEPMVKDKEQTTNPASVREITDSSSFSISPNPAADYITVNYQVTTPGEMYIEVVNIIGTRLFRGRIMRSNTIIPLAQLAPGNYFVRVYNRDTSMVRKFIKM